MIELIDAETGCNLMRRWGVTDWSDPGAEYALWDGACVFAFVPQQGFVDVHMAINHQRLRDCRKAGAKMLEHVGHHLLRAVILTDRPRVCNYAARMGFGRRSTETLTTVDGSESSFFIMWREPGDYHGRCD